MFGKKKIFFYVVLIVALASLLVACGGAAATEAPAADAPAVDAVATDVPAGDATATEVPAADAPTAVVDAPTAAPVSGDVVPQFVFTNTGSAELCNLYLSPVGVDSWGPDQLGGLTIKAGEKFTLKNIPAATYDVKVVGCNNAGEQVIKLDIKN